MKLVALFLTAWCFSSHGGVVLTQEMQILQGGNKDKKGSLTMYLGSGNARMEIAAPNAPKSTVIFDGKKKETIVLQPEQKQFLKFNKETLASISQMAKFLPNQGKTSSLQKGKMVFSKPKGTDKVGNWSCTKYDVSQGNKPVMEVCVAPFNTLGLKAADMAPLREMSEMVSQSNLPGADYGRWDALMEKGFPIMTHHKDAHFRTTDISRKDLAANTFAVPAGYSELVIPNFSNLGQQIQQMQKLQEKNTPKKK